MTPFGRSIHMLGNLLSPETEHQLGLQRGSGAP